MMRVRRPRILSISGKADRGFVLLTSIWMLVLTGALASAALIAARTASLAIRQNYDSALATLALAQAQDEVIHDLMTRGRYGRWGKGAVSSQVNVVDNIPVTVRISNEAGQIDLLSADPDLVQQLIKQIARALTDGGAPVDAEAATRSLRKLQARNSGEPLQRSLRSLEELASLDGWTPELVACVKSYATLHTGQQRPASAYALPLIQQILGNDKTEAKPNHSIGGERSLAGEVFRLEMNASASSLSRSSRMIIRLTGSKTEAYWILDHDHSAGLNSLPVRCSA
jgi:hypothetical protein